MLACKLWVLCYGTVTKLWLVEFTTRNKSAQTPTWKDLLHEQSVKPWRSERLPKRHRNAWFLVIRTPRVLNEIVSLKCLQRVDSTHYIISKSNYSCVLAARSPPRHTPLTGTWLSPEKTKYWSCFKQLHSTWRHRLFFFFTPIFYG